MAPERTKKRVKKESHGPPTAVIRDGKRILVTWPLAGISEEMIQIDLEGTSLVLSAKTRDRTMVQTIKVPTGLRISRKRFFNNTLELTLEPPV